MNPSEKVRKQRKDKNQIFAPFMVYMEPKELQVLKDYAARSGKSAGAILREGMRIRLSGDKDPYALGFNDAIDASIKIVQSVNEAKIVMPSGMSIAQLLTERLEREYMEAIRHA